MADRMFWAVEGGSPDHSEGTREVAIEATSNADARAKYLGNKPDHWVVFSAEQIAIVGDESTLRPRDNSQGMDIEGDLIHELPHKEFDPADYDRKKIVDGGMTRAQARAEAAKAKKAAAKEE